LSALEVAQALTELQHPAPRTQILRHLKDRGYGVGKEIDFFEFLRAYSALVVEKDYAPSEGVRSSKRQAKTEVSWEQPQLKAVTNRLQLQVPQISS
jgi:hypothetical protein